MTQTELARDIGVSVATIHYYVTGQRCPKLRTAMRIAARTGVSLESLLAPEPDGDAA